MKKFMMAAVTVAAAWTGVNAQDVVTPGEGDFSIEVQINPFSNDFETFRMPSLQGRYFFNSKDALRFGLGFGINTEKKNGATENSDIWSKNRISHFSIDLGYERHFYNHKRVDLYGGGEVGFSLQTTCKTEQFLNDNVIYQTKHFNQDSWNEFAVRAFTGIDFYLYKGLYVGAELGVKIGFKNFPGEYEKGFVNDNGIWDDSTKHNEMPNSTSFVLGTYIEPALRLGWTF